MSEGARSRGRAGFVPLLVPESGDLKRRWAYYSRMVEALNGKLLEYRLFMRLVPCLHEYQRDHFLATLGGQYAGAIFLGPTYVYRPFIEAVCERLEGPKVMLDHHFDDLLLHSVRDDAEAGMRQVTGHLLALGHRHVAYLDHEDPAANPWKRRGIDAALGEAGLPGLVRERVAGCRHNFADAAAALDWFLGLEPRPTAVVAAADGLALLLIRAAAERGMQVPADLSVAGYGDFAALTGRSKALTSAGVDPAAIGRRAAELVAGAAGKEPVAALIEPRMVIRTSTAPPPAG
jgi:DNA-binding LacI/PurR family transcriptional regulator